MVNAFIILCKYYNPLLAFFQLNHDNLASFALFLHYFSHDGEKAAAGTSCLLRDGKRMKKLLPEAFLGFEVILSDLYGIMMLQK